MQDSERIKTLYGSVLLGGADEREMITVPTVSGEDREAPRSVSRAALNRIVKPRAEEILELCVTGWRHRPSRRNRAVAWF